MGAARPECRLRSLSSSSIGASVRGLSPRPCERRALESKSTRLTSQTTRPTRKF